MKAELLLSHCGCQVGESFAKKTCTDGTAWLSQQLHLFSNTVKFVYCLDLLVVHIEILDRKF